jgi:hypothetical protein
MSTWPPDESVPPLHSRDGAPLSPSEIAALLDLLRTLPEPVRVTCENRHPRQPWRRAELPPELSSQFATLRERCGELALDTWMAKLMSAWLFDIGSGTARKFRWVVPAAANIGGNACAALIGSHLRGENYQLRCTGEVGVEALIDIGTRGALLELAHLGRKFPRKTRGEMAQNALEQTAKAKGLTADQLQDRILPDCGLDAEGRRSFDYGPRKFDLVLDEQLLPALRSADGRRMTTLPKPNAKDDATLSAEARATWKIAKTQIAQTARWLAARFQSAMVDGDAWSAADFDENFRRHPLARLIVRRLLWTCTTSGKPICFRIAEDDTLADRNDAPLQLPADAADLRPVHPLQLPHDALEAWARLFAEYQIVSPFPQLDRPVFQVAPQDTALRVITTFPHTNVDVRALIFPLENRGWEREQSPDNGTLNRHTRTFRNARTTACLHYDPGGFLGDLPGSGIQTLTQLYFVHASSHPHPSKAVPLGDVPAFAYSEAMRDIHSLIPA